MLIKTTPIDPFNLQVAQIFFYHQLVLNLLWLVIFFYFRQPKVALMEIVLLLIFVIFTVITTYRINKKAGLLLVPYLALITITTYQNLMIARLNK